MSTGTSSADDAVDAIDAREREVDGDVERIVATGPSGAFAVAGVATALVVAMYFAFYVFAYLPRGIVQ